jgi:hypothetical protein
MYESHQQLSQYYTEQANWAQFNIEDLCTLNAEVMAYSSALEQCLIDNHGGVRALETAGTPKLRDIFYKTHKTIDRDFADAVNKARVEIDPTEQNKLQIDAPSDQIHYIDLLSQIIAGNVNQMTPSIISTPAANALMSDALKTDENAALCREIGAHNLAEIIQTKALCLQ